MMHPPDWLNSVMFLLIGILALVRKTPTKREDIGGVNIVVSDPGAIDKFLVFWEKFQAVVLRVVGATIFASFVWRITR